jgi:hypothetical protein
MVGTSLSRTPTPPRLARPKGGLSYPPREDIESVTYRDMIRYNMVREYGVISSRNTVRALMYMGCTGW